MTLVIAGHDIKKADTKEAYIAETRGLFVVADSTITSGSQTLLSGFKKIYSMPIKVFQPYFVGSHFHSYQTVFCETECFIAFAGSTLTAQHVLNGIGNHLNVLRIGHDRARGGYLVLMNCEVNSLTHRAGIDEWDEDMFTNADMRGLLTGDIISKTVLHAIKGALAGAKKHKIDAAGFKMLLTQYVLGIYCEAQERHRLYTFIPRLRQDALGQIEDIAVDLREISPGEICVLGMTQFATSAEAEFSRAFSSGEDVKDAMFQFMNTAIDQVQAAGKLEIDRPSLLKGFHRGTLTELNRSIAPSH